MVGRIMPHFIEVRQGDSFTIPLQIKGKNGFIDITGAELKMQIRKRADNKILVTKTGVIDDGIKGKAHLALIPADTKNLIAGGEYLTDIQITFPNGEVHTIYPADVSKVASFIVSQHITE